jgi:hypothetical protein
LVIGRGGLVEGGSRRLCRGALTGQYSPYASHPPDPPRPRAGAPVCRLRPRPGMNMRSTLEMNVLSFWGVSVAIVLGCGYLFMAIMKYTRSKRIL